MNTEKLYEAFGELIYAVAKADGDVQSEEIWKLKELLRGHDYADDILWSFTYEKNRNTLLSDAYDKALQVMIAYGPSDQYDHLLYVLEEVARASDGVDESELFIIERFKKELADGLFAKLNKR